MGPLSGSDWLTQWQWSWAGVGCALLVVVAQQWITRRGRRSVEIWRQAGFWVLGIGSLLYVTCGPVGVGSRTLLWLFATKVAVLASVTPIGLSLGWTTEPVHPTGAWRVVARTLAFPGVSSVIATASIIAVFYTSYGERAGRSGLIDTVLVVHLLAVGCLVTMPLLVDGVLPRWAGPGTRALLACADGLLDAVPGILLMTATHLLMPHFVGFSGGQWAARSGLSPELDQKFAGGALLAVAESIGLPMLALVFVEWVKADRNQAAALDRAADARGEADLDEFGGTRPWWLSER